MTNAPRPAARVGNGAVQDQTRTCDGSGRKPTVRTGATLSDSIARGLEQFGKPPIELGLLDAIDLQQLARLRVSTDDFDLRRSQAECSGDKGYDGLVRLPPLRRRRDLNFDGVAQ